MHVDAIQHPLLWGGIHFFRGCAWVCFCASIVTNFLPCEEMFRRHETRRVFLYIVAIISLLAINLRRNQPSLGVLSIPGRKKYAACSPDRNDPSIAPTATR